MEEMKSLSGTAPQLYRPRSPLAPYIDYFGYWRRESGEPHQSRALPRGAATIIVDVGGRQRVDFYAADGRTRLDVPPAFIAGAGTASYVTQIDAAQSVLTIHFRPAGALPSPGFRWASWRIPASVLQTSGDIEERRCTSGWSRPAQQRSGLHWWSHSCCPACEVTTSNLISM
jgi:hypothetical protein